MVVRVEKSVSVDISRSVVVYGIDVVTTDVLQRVSDEITVYG